MNEGQGESVMDLAYIENCTRDWEQVSEGDDYVQLWTFFDTVQWKKRFAIKVGGVVKSEFGSSAGSPYEILRIVRESVTEQQSGEN